MARATVSADVNTVRRFSKAVKERGLKVSKVAEALFDLAANLLEEGYTPEQVFGIFDTLKSLSIYELAFIPLEFIEELYTVACSAEENKIDSLVESYGERMGMQLSAIFPDLEDLIRDLYVGATFMLPNKKIELKIDGDVARVLVVGLGKTEALPRMFVYMTRGFLKGYRGSALISSSTGPGVVSLEIKLPSRA